jgi:hypothetical protein
MEQRSNGDDSKRNRQSWQLSQKMCASHMRPRFAVRHDGRTNCNGNRQPSGRDRTIDPCIESSTTLFPVSSSKPPCSAIRGSLRLLELPSSTFCALHQCFCPAPQDVQFYSASRELTGPRIQVCKVHRYPLLGLFR